MRDILLKLMLADLSQLNFFIDILNIGGRQRYNIVRINSSCLAVGRRLF